MARPNGARITREAIIDAALRIIDAHGMEGLSIRRIGADLGVDGSSLYHHVSGKDEIIDAAAARVLSHIRPPKGDGEDWKAQLVENCLQVRRALSAHPNMIQALVARRQWKFGLPVFEHTGQAMTRSGIPPAEQLLIWESLDALTLSGLLLKTSGRMATAEVDGLDTAYPAVYAAMHAEQPDEETRLAHSLRAFLAGIELLRAPAAPPRARAGRSRR